MQLAWGFAIVFLLGAAGGAAAKLLAGDGLSWMRAFVLGIIGALAGEVVGTVAGTWLLATYMIRLSAISFWVSSLLMVGVPAFVLPLAVGLAARRHRIAAG